MKYREMAGENIGIGIRLYEISDNVKNAEDIDSEKSAKNA